MSKKKLTLDQKNQLEGLCFVLPFIIGIIVFFLIPMFQSLYYSFCKVTVEPGGFVTEFINMENYTKILFKDPEFIPLFFKTIGQMIYQVPIVIMLSLFLAVILNQEFKGRTFFRGVLFLTMIISSGIVVEFIREDPLTQLLNSSVSAGVDAVGGENTAMMTLNSMFMVLVRMGIPPQIVDSVLNVASSIFENIWYCGVQIILFLAGLQTISPSIYEAVKIEGANAWETFWKITIPMIFPIVVLNVIYSIVDFFTNAQNGVMKMAGRLSSGAYYGEAAAVSWLYFVVVGAILCIGTIYISRRMKVRD